jgi:hypothetical protein
MEENEDMTFSDLENLDDLEEEDFMVCIRISLNFFYLGSRLTHQFFLR